MEDLSGDSPLRDVLNEILSGTLRARALVKHILTFSRQENCEIKLMKIQSVLKEALNLIRATIPTTIDIVQKIKADCGTIKANPTQIHQRVMNLATNAYHAMEETGGKLIVSLKEVGLGNAVLIYPDMHPDMHPDVYACLSIADTGIGRGNRISCISADCGAKNNRNV